MAEITESVRWENASTAAVGTQRRRSIEGNFVRAGQMVEESNPADKAFIVKQAKEWRTNHYSRRQDIPLRIWRDHKERGVGWLIIIARGVIVGRSGIKVPSHCNSTGNPARTASNIARTHDYPALPCYG